MTRYLIFIAAWFAGFGLGIELTIKLGARGLVTADAFTAGMMWPTIAVLVVIGLEHALQVYING